MQVRHHVCADACPETERVGFVLVYEHVGACFTCGGGGVEGGSGFRVDRLGREVKAGVVAGLERRGGRGWVWRSG